MTRFDGPDTQEEAMSTTGTATTSVSAPPLDLSLCTECGWHVRNPREYHPLVACWIVQKVGRDPLPYLRGVAADMANVNEDGEFPGRRKP